MKKRIAILLVLITVLAMIPVAASAEEDYVIHCTHEKCPGYRYVYDEPDSMYSRNLGRMNNGTHVTYYRYTSNNQGGWYYISGCNTKGAYIYGYIHSWSAEPSGSGRQDPVPPSNEYETTVYCTHEKCPGYCYVYDSPDSMYRRNLGRMNNGTRVTVYNYTSNNQGGWYYISGYNTKGAFIYGYVHSWSLR